jgi:serine/threonine protein kinase
VLLASEKDPQHTQETIVTGFNPVADGKQEPPADPNSEPDDETMIHTTVPQQKEAESVEEDEAGLTKETMILGDGQGGTPAATESETDRTAQLPTSDDNAKYEIVKELGKGGFAWVYLVRNRDLDRLEAMKILNSDLSEEEDVTNRFVQEARISANFNHTNIITIYEVQRRGKWDNFSAAPHIVQRHKEPFVYFTMSFVEGQTVTNWIRKRTRIDQAEAVTLAIDACNALDYAHTKGVIHRDIKPDNILIDRQGLGIVMDFGIAKVVDQTRQTAAGTFMGTARYVSPEQAMGRAIDGRSDLYSLGITIYEMVTGRVPFNSDQWMTVLYQHINEPPPPPEKYFDQINRDLRGVVLKMLEKKPENRFQTAKEAVEALDIVLQRMGGRKVSTKPMNEIDTKQNFAQDQIDATAATEIQRPTAPPVRGKTTEHRAKEATPPPVPAAAPVEEPKSNMSMIIGAVALVAILAGLGWFLTRPGADTDPVPVQPVQQQSQQQETTPTPTPVAGPDGRLMISAFPRGEAINIIETSGKNFDLGTIELPAALPLKLDLPEGNYKIIVSYSGRTQEVSAYVSDKIDLAKAHAIFEMEDSQFLLEDLR